MKKPADTKSTPIAPGEADAIAIAILTWLSADHDLMGRFLAITGIEAGTIRSLVGQAGFSGGLTGFLMQHEPTLMKFCVDSGLGVEHVQAAHRHFSGPGDEAWL